MAALKILVAIVQKMLRSSSAWQMFVSAVVTLLVAVYHLVPVKWIGSRPCTTVAVFNDFRGICFGATSILNFVAFVFLALEDYGKPVEFASGQNAGTLLLCVWGFAALLITALIGWLR